MRQIYRFELDADHCTALAVGRACVMVIEAGRIWLTIEGQPRDHWLGCGDQLALEPGWRVWVSAPASSEGARLKLIEPIRQMAHRRRWRVWSALLALARGLAPTLGPVEQR